MASVSIRAAKKRFASTEVLRGVSIEVPQGSFTVLVGPRAAARARCCA